MIWADRLGVCLAMLWLLWAAAAVPERREELAAFFLIVFVAAPWVFCRMLHFLATGRVLPQRQDRPWRHDQRVNLRVALVVLTLAAIVYLVPFGLVQGIALFTLIIFGYWLISSAGHSSAFSRGEISAPAEAVHRKDRSVLDKGRPSATAATFRLERP